MVAIELLKEQSCCLRKIDSASVELASLHVFSLQIDVYNFCFDSKIPSFVRLIKGSNMDSCILGLRFQQFLGDGEGFY